MRWVGGREGGGFAEAAVRRKWRAERTSPSRACWCPSAQGRKGQKVVEHSFCCYCCHHCSGAFAFIFPFSSFLFIPFLHFFNEVGVPSVLPSPPCFHILTLPPSPPALQTSVIEGQNKSRVHPLSPTFSLDLPPLCSPQASISSTALLQSLT